MAQRQDRAGFLLKFESGRSGLDRAEQDRGGKGQVRITEHGWDDVAWCLDDGGETVARALRAAIERLPCELAADQTNAAARDGAWERHGIQGRLLQAQVLSHVRAGVVRRMTATLATVSVVAA